MATPNFASESIWTGDNLTVLRGINSNCIDLSALAVKLVDNRIAEDRGLWGGATALTEPPKRTDLVGTLPNYRTHRHRLYGEQEGVCMGCETINILYDWAFERESNDIYQDEGRMTLQYGYVDLVRTIHMDRSEHPEDIEPSVTGHSIGWWEDHTLVVDTIGFEPGVFDHLDWPRFRMHSDQWHVVERFRVSDDGRTLTRSYTFSDPLYMVGSYTGQDTHSLTGEPYVPYKCEDLGGLNNQRPEGE